MKVKLMDFDSAKDVTVDTVYESEDKTIMGIPRRHWNKMVEKPSLFVKNNGGTEYLIDEHEYWVPSICCMEVAE